MEKIWFHNFRLRAASALALFFIHSSLLAEIKTVDVEVEVPVENENIAAARTASQKMAFEKALDQILPPTLDAAQRAEMIKNAKQSIAGYRVASEKLEGTSLKVHYQLDVSISLPAPQPSQVVGESPRPATDEKAVFEISWLPEGPQISIVDLTKFLRETMDAPSSSARLSRGNIVVTVPLKKSLQETQTLLAGFVGKSGLVRLVRLDEARPPDALPAPISNPNTPMESAPFMPITPTTLPAPIEPLPQQMAPVPAPEIPTPPPSVSTPPLPPPTMAPNP